VSNEIERQGAPRMLVPTVVAGKAELDRALGKFERHDEFF
jgi:hypothetical protein